VAEPEPIWFQGGKKKERGNWSKRKKGSALLFRPRISTLYPRERKKGEKKKESEFSQTEKKKKKKRVEKDLLQS